MRVISSTEVRMLGAKSLRSVEMKHLQAYKAQLEPREFECAHHIVSEIARVAAGERVGTVISTPGRKR